MNSKENLEPGVIFSNEPKLSEHQADEEFNKRRVELIPHIKNFLATHERFKDQKINITFAHKGTSSLICIIDMESEKMVLKLPLSKSYSEGEGQFLKKWQEMGVKVPEVIETGELAGHSYTLMEFIEAPRLSEVQSSEELTQNGGYLEMGRTLQKMHTGEATGYGRVIKGQAEYSEFKDLLAGEDMQIRINYVKEYNQLNEKHGSLPQALELLIEHVENKKSSYCHDDFGAANIFATRPLTIFDPNPRFNNGYLDLGRSLLLHIANGIYPKQLIEGYFENEPYDKNVLEAAILLNAYMKFPYWHKKDKVKEIARVQEYLQQTELSRVEQTFG